MADQEQELANLTAAVNQLLARQDRLESRLARLEQSLLDPNVVPSIPIPPAPEPKPVAAVPTPHPVETPPTPAAPSIPTPSPPPQQPQLETKVGLTIINRVGVVTLVLGIAFFFKWAVDNNWIGPSARVLLGVIVGLLTLVIADALWRRAQQIFAQGLTGAGAAIIYIAFYAAFDFYHLVPPLAAFLLLLATTVLAVVLALRYTAVAIAALGFFGAYLIPLLLSNGSDRPWFLIAYLVLINFAARQLALRRSWRPLELLSLLATVFTFGPWLIFQAEPRAQDKLPSTIGILVLLAQRFFTSWPLLFLIAQALATFGAVFVWNQSANFVWMAILVALAGLAFAHRHQYPPIVSTAFASFWIATSLSTIDTGPLQVFAVASAGFLLFAVWFYWRFASVRETPTPTALAAFALNGVVYYGIVYAALHSHYHAWLGLLALTVAAFYFALALQLRRSVDEQTESHPAPLALGLSLAFLALAIPIQLSGFTVPIAWSIQATVLAWIAVRLKNPRTLLMSTIIFGLALCRLVFVDLVTYGYNWRIQPVFLNTRFLTFAVLGIALLLAAYWCVRLHTRVARGQFIAGHAILLTGLSLEIADWAYKSVAPENLLSVQTMGITLLFAFYATVLISFGVAKRSPISRLTGLGLTALVILKLYLFDVWQLGRFYQILAFVILGILLLATSFLYSRFKNLIGEWRKDDASRAL